MKKRISLALAAIMATAALFSACGGNGGDATSSGADNSAASTASTASKDATSSTADETSSVEVVAVDTPYADALLRTDKFGFAKQKNSKVLNLAEDGTDGGLMAYGRAPVTDTDSEKRYPGEKLMVGGEEKKTGIFFQHNWNGSNVYITCDIPAGSKKLELNMGLTDGILADYAASVGGQPENIEVYAGEINDDNYEEAGDPLGTIKDISDTNPRGSVTVDLPADATQVTIVKTGSAFYCHMAIYDSFFRV